MPRKTKIAVNPEDHLGILHHVVQSATLGIPYHLRDEALSEGMVLLVRAAQSYEAKHGVPPHYWIAKKLRWGLKNWKIAEFSRHGANDELMEPLRRHGDETVELQEREDIVGLLDDPVYRHEVRLELEHLVALADEHLTDDEYIAIMGPAFGLQMKEISHALGANPTQILKLQARGRSVINEMRLL